MTLTALVGRIMAGEGLAEEEFIDRYGILFLAILAGIVFFGRLGQSALTDWDEAWHAEVSSEVLSTGEWLPLHDRGLPYFNKPPLTFWMRAIAFRSAQRVSP